MMKEGRGGALFPSSIVILHSYFYQILLPPSLFILPSRMEALLQYGSYKLKVEYCYSFGPATGWEFPDWIPSSARVNLSHLLGSGEKKDVHIVI